jgi:hypothetical protein
MGVFNRFCAALCAEGNKPDQLMIDATHRKVDRTAASLLSKGLVQTYRAHQGRPELQSSCPRHLHHRNRRLLAQSTAPKPR